MKYQEVVDYLYNIPRFTKGGHMENVRMLLEAFDCPQDSFRYIHVAGTNGKGSVCAYMEQCLRLCHQRTGLFTSPHLVRVNERMKINGKEISNEDFVRLFLTVRSKVEHMKARDLMEPTFFEYIYVMAMLYFREQKIDYGVIETGLGGRMDFTNVVREPILTVITSIGLDHTEVLGNSIEAIAMEKAGIIKAGTPLVYYDQDERVSEIIRAQAARHHVQAVKLTDENIKILEDHGCTIDFSLKYGYDVNYILTLNTAAVYQTINSSLAVMGLRLLWPGLCAAKDADSQFELLIKKGLKSAYWPGRMEAVDTDLFVDGAHNEAGIEAFAATIAQGFADRPLILVFAVAGDKDYEPMIQRLCSLENLRAVVVTELENGRRCSSSVIAGIFRKNWNGFVCETYNIREALKQGLMLRQNNGIVCCVGSLYLAGSVKEILGGKSFD